MPNNLTQIPAARVPIADLRDGAPSHPWFRFFQQVFEFIGIGKGVMPTTSGGTGNTAYAIGDLLVGGTNNALLRLPAATTASFLGTDGTNIPQWIQVGYGAFGDTAATTVAAANTPTAIALNTAVYSRNIHLGTPNSRIYVDNEGTYRISISVQFQNTSTTDDDDVLVWFKVMGSDLAYSASYTSIAKKHAGKNGSALIGLDILYAFTAGQYFELYWLSKNGTTQIVTIPGSTVPLYPAAPGTIVTVNQIV